MADEHAVHCENQYATKAQSNLNTVLAAIGAAGTTGVLGNLGGVFANNGNVCSENQYVNRYEAKLQAENAELKTELKLRDSTIYTDSKILEVYKYIDGKNAHFENQLCEQRVYNATLNGVVSCIQGQIAQLQGLTKLVIPNPSVCPGWGNVTITPETTTTTA